MLVTLSYSAAVVGTTLTGTMAYELLLSLTSVRKSLARELIAKSGFETASRIYSGSGA